MSLTLADRQVEIILVLLQKDLVKTCMALSQARQYPRSLLGKTNLSTAEIRTRVTQQVEKTEALEEYATLIKNTIANLTGNRTG